MAAGLSTLLLVLALSQPGTQVTGTIDGVVLNASQENTPVAQAEVILQVQMEGEFAPVEKTETDWLGRFHFDNLPVGPDALYLPGATRDEIFYPGRRIELSANQRTAHLNVAVRDTIRQPDPLVIREHEVVMRPEAGVLQVVEAMLVDNPSDQTYIGNGAPDAKMIPTFHLGIPSDFSRLTFEKEFFGRQFHLIDGQVLTTIPWTPGQRWIRFTYSIPNDESRRVWEHRFDVPCEHAVIRVQHERAEDVASSLGAPSSVQSGEAVFELSKDQLAGIDSIQITLGKLPVPWTSFAKWIAAGILLTLIGSVYLLRRVRRKASRVAVDASLRKLDHHDAHATRARKSRRKQQRRAA